MELIWYMGEVVGWGCSECGFIDRHSLTKPSQCKRCQEKSRQKRDYWKQDTPREQMVVLTQAIAGYAICADDLEWTPERMRQVLKYIKEHCDDLLELSKWMDSQWKRQT
jgi:hypothetical protein